MVRPHPPIIIDIEASGFGAESYPIEIGVVLNDGRKYCSLIQPRPEWTHWDEGAERVHHLSRDLLWTHGKPVQEVASTLNQMLRAQTVFSDGWVVDKPWLDRLFYAAGMHCEFYFSDIEMILSEPQMEIWHTTKDAVLHGIGHRRHRASFDAFVIQETYERTWNLVSSGKSTPAAVARP